MILVIAEKFFEHGEQPACASSLRGGGLGNQAQCFVIETDVDPVSAEGALVLPQQAALRKFHDLEKIVRVEIETDDAHRQTSDKFRLEPVLDEIFRSHVLKQFVVHYLHRIGPETDLSLTHPPGHLLLQFFKRAADHEQNVTSVDRLPFCFAFTLKLKRGL